MNNISPNDEQKLLPKDEIATLSKLAQKHNKKLGLIFYINEGELKYDIELLEEKKPLIKLIRWLIFSVTFAMLPFVFKIGSGMIRGFSFNWEFLLGNGELFIVSSTLCAVAVGELFGSSSKKTFLQIILGGMGILIIALASFAYADVSFGKGELLINRVMLISSVLFISSILVSSACIVVTELKGKQHEY